MAVLTKAKKPARRPRCEATNSRRLRCQFQGVEYVNNRFVCRCHAAKLRGSTNPIEGHSKALRSTEISRVQP